MKTQISRPACAPRHDQSATSVTLSAASAARLRYRAHLGAKRALFAAPPVDLTTLVIAEAIKRRAQAELQRPALRDAYELPVSHERTDARDASVRPPKSGDAD
ncbi:hypothetical protein [Burkholderia sp. WSM2232]|uniref:hypothetical protein n=1 Tax=Burkholderia sp. WSM2232 TaxID=944436 RepID=UPI0003F8BA18|nr:hypothetical protein [Burkholderia sp. WSM2232]